MTMTTTKSSTARRRGMILGGLLIAALAAGIIASACTVGSTARTPAGTTAGTTAGTAAGTPAGPTRAESATPGPVDVKGYNSSAFRVQNSSPFTLRQISSTTGYDWQMVPTPPYDGLTIKPGDKVHYEAVTPFGVGATTSTINYYVVNGNGRVVGSASGRLEVNDFTGKAAMSCQSVSGPFTCSSNGWDTITVTAKSPTQVDSQ